MPRVSSHFSIQDSRHGSVVIELLTWTVNSTDANQTYTPAQLLGGLIDRSIAAARTDTLPSAAALVEFVQGAMAGTGLAIPNVLSGHSFEFYIRNKSGGANTLTVAVGAGGTADAGSTLTVAQNNTRTFKILFTNVGVGTEAYTLMSLGAGTT